MTISTLECIHRLLLNNVNDTKAELEAARKREKEQNVDLPDTSVKLISYQMAIKALNDFEAQEF